MDVLIKLFIIMSIIAHQKIQHLQAVELVKAREKWFEAYLDNFDPWNFKSLKLRYFEYLDFYNNNTNDNILAIQIGSHETIKDYTIATYPSYRFAKAVKAVLIYLETRFYGKSKPSDFTGTIKSGYLQFINVEQTLEDIAYFIQWYKNSTLAVKKGKVIIFGCSYGGTLAALMRFKFPHLVIGSFTMGTPLEPGLYPRYFPYHEDDEFAIAYNWRNFVGKNCTDAILKAYTAVGNTLSNDTAFAQFKNKIKDWHCGNVNKMNEEEILYKVRKVLAGPFNRAAIHKQICTFLKYGANDTDTDHVASLIVTISCEVCANERYTALLEDRNDVVKWFQMCTEFSRFSVPFNLSLEDTFNITVDCAYIFFSNEYTYASRILENGVRRKEQLYGAPDLKRLAYYNDVFIIHGRYDLWKPQAYYTFLMGKYPNKYLKNLLGMPVSKLMDIKYSIVKMDNGDSCDVKDINPPPSGSLTELIKCALDL